MPNNSPATPLPWGALEHQHIRPMEDAGYIFHACNAYPQLVEALRASRKLSPEWAKCVNDLLRSLGEKV